MPDARPTPGHEHFRAGVGAMILSRDGAILLLRRTDVERDAWQLPQGGLHSGEDPRGAVLRELEEETGLSATDLEILEETTEWIAYELPDAYRSAKTGRGQVQKWYLCRLTADESRVRPDGVEFDAWRWVQPEELLGHTVDFRRPVYRRLLEAFSSHLR